MYHIEKKSHFIKTLYTIKGIRITNTWIKKIVHGSGYNVLYVMKRYWIIRILRAKHLRKTSMFIPLKIIITLLANKKHNHNLVAITDQL